MKILFCIISFIVLSFPSSAQFATNFFVVNIKGSGYYIRDKYRIPLKIGSSLALSDEVVLNNQSSLTIICNNYSLFTIINMQPSNPQTASLRNYADSCGVPQSNVSLGFLQYLWQHLQEEDITTNTPTQDNIKEFGAAERGCADAAFNMIRDTINVYHNSFAIQYHSLDTSAQIEFVVYDELSPDTLYKSYVHKNRIDITDGLIHIMDTSKIYRWTLIRNGMELCERKIIQKTGEAEYNKIIAPADEKNFNALPQDEQNKILAFLLNEKNLPGEAVHYLELTRLKKDDVVLKLLKQNLESEFVF